VEDCFCFSSLSHVIFLSCIASILETPYKGLSVLLFKLNLFRLASSYFMCTALSAEHCCLFSEGEYLRFPAIVLSTEEFN